MKKLLEKKKAFQLTKHVFLFSYLSTSPTFKAHNLFISCSF
jgi:hypothetical protein